MALFKSEHRSLKYTSMAEDLQSYAVGVKCFRDDVYRDENHLEYGTYQERGFTYYNPVSVKAIPNGTSSPKPPRSTSSSYTSLRCRKSRSRISYSRGNQLKMEELQCIKRELKVIKNQIDELLNSLEHMDTRGRDNSEGGLAHSQLCGSVVSSVESSSYSPLRTTRAFRQRQSLEPRGPRDEERQVKTHKSDLYYI